jgi:glycerophosphoryl diester phosphodiesterase
MKLFDTPFAHRGLHDEKTPENSMESFKKAIDKGYGIEIDVRLLKDGKIAVFHDASLKRMCGQDKAIGKLTSKDLEKEIYKLPNGEKIPLLCEFLEFVNERCAILLEIKSLSISKFRLEKAVYEQIKGKENYILIQAFNPYTIMWLRKNAPEFTRGQLANKSRGLLKIAYGLARPYRMLKLGKPHFLAYNIKWMPSVRIANAVKDYNMKYLCWTVKTEAQLQVAKDCNVDQVIFERVDPSFFDKNNKPAETVEPAEVMTADKKLADN